MDAITISELIVMIRIGCGDEERAKPQPIRIDLTAETDFSDVLSTRDLRLGVDYSALRKKIKKIAGAGEYALLEELGGEILGEIFQDERVSAARISIRKVRRWYDAIPGIIMSRRRSNRFVK